MPIAPPLRSGVSSAPPSLTALTHPHIRRVLSAAVTPSPVPTLALTLAATDGVSLPVWLARPVSPAERLTLTRAILDQLCQACAAAHRITPPLAHGALRPDCINVERRGQQPFVRVEGFGLFDLQPLAPDARLPPETDPADPRASPAGDLFALGVMLATLLTGAEPPLHADAGLTCAWVTARFPSASPSLRAIVLRCMAPSPDERPADVVALRDLLRAADWSPCEPALPVSPPTGAPARDGSLPPPAPAPEHETVHPVPVAAPENKAAPPPPLEEPLDEETIIERAPRAPTEEITSPYVGLPTRRPVADEGTLVARSPIADDTTLPVSVREDTDVEAAARCDETEPLAGPPTAPCDDESEATAIERHPAAPLEALEHEPTLPIDPPRRSPSASPRDREGVPWSAVVLLLVGVAILAFIAWWGVRR